MTKTSTLLVAAAACALLAGCGGGDGAPAASPLDAVPASANASPEGMAAYLKSLAREQPDDREPLDLAGWAPPASETAEPAAID